MTRTPETLRALDVLSRVSHQGEVLAYDLSTVCPCVGADIQTVTAAIVEDNGHVVEYTTPELEPFRAAAVRSDSEELKRTATFGRFRARS